MSGELFDEVDDLVVFGNPWHGYEEAGTGTLKTDSGDEISGVYDGLPSDGWNRVTDFGAPAISTSTADAALGMTWLNRCVWVGAKKRVCAVRSPGVTGEFEVRALAWPYLASDGTVWWLEAGVVTIDDDELKVFARQMPMPEFTEFGVNATEVASLSIVAGSFKNAWGWVNFAPDGNLAAIHCAPSHAWGDQYSVTCWECEITEGSSTTPPTVSLFVSPADFAGTDDTTDYVLERGQVLTSLTQLYSYAPDNPYDFTGPFYRLEVTGTIPGGDIIPGPGYVGGGDRTEETWTIAKAVVFTLSGARKVLARRSMHRTEELTTVISASGYLDGTNPIYVSIAPSGTYGNIANEAVVSYRFRSLVYGSEQILLGDEVVAEVVIQHTENTMSVVYTENDSGDLTQEVDMNEFYFEGVDRDYFVANGETVLIVATEDPRSIIAYGNSRGGGEFAEGSLPEMSSLSNFSTHPFTGVFDPDKVRYF